MKTNTWENFQAIAIGKNTANLGITFDIEGNKSTCDKEVKLLGVTFDFMLNFNSQISNISKNHPDN